MITTICKISYGSQTVPPIVPAVQGDTGRAISFEIADFTPPAGATATYFILKPSGEAIYNSATITDNSILCELTAQSLAEAGENRMQVRVLQGENIVTSFEVILMVRTFLGDDAMESGTEMNIFDQAVEQATEDFQTNAEQIVEEVIESIPSDYTALTEEVDELNERLGDKADQTEVDDLKSALDANDIIIESLTPTIFSNCSIYSNGVIIDSSGFNVYVFDITGIERIKVDSGSIYAFYNTLPVKNSTSSVDATRHVRALSNTELKAPNGANYVAIRHTEAPTVTDIDTLKRTVDDLEYLKGFNTKDITFSVTGKYINQSGTETLNAEYKSTGYIAVAGGSLFNIHAFYSAQACFAVYDADKNLISATANSGSVGDSLTFTLPHNARYVRWSLNVNYEYEINSVTAYINNTIDDLIIPNERCGYNGYEINVFKHGICIGDSLTAGTFNYDDNGVNKSDYADVNYSFPKMLSKLTGIDIYASAVGGNTSYEWYQDHISAVIAGFDFAIIQFGVNDALEYNGWTTDSVSGFTGIINMLKRDNNGIKIFVATTIPALAYSGQAFNDVNNGIRELVASMNDENVILLDMAKYGSTKLRQYNAGHLTAIGYSRLAMDYKNFISWYIAENADQFRAVQFIGTNKTIPSTYD